MTALATAGSPGHVVFTEAGERVELTAQQFVAGGGEGNVYALGSRGFKIAHQPKDACPPGKIAELARIGDDKVLAPVGSLLDRDPRGPRGLRARGPVVVGHELPFASDTWTACELIPVAFRQRHGLSPAIIPALVAQLRERVAAVHAAGCRVVDLSEANVLVSRDFSDALLIDVDSFATPSFPATAIAPTVHDPTRAMGYFDESTDWFSFAVLAFSLLTGIHPFRGKHPTVKGLAARMKAGISVFDPAVRLPRACRPVSSIPNPWRDWLRATLQHGERRPPPRPGGGLTLGTTPNPRATAAALRMDPCFEAPHAIRAVLEARGRRVVHAGSQVWVDGDARLDVDSVVALGMSPNGHPVAAWIDAGRLRLFDLDRGRAIACQAAARQLGSVRGTLFAASGDAVHRIELVEVGDTLIAGLRPAVRVAPQASRLWRGCVIQQLLGATTVSLLSERGTAAQHRVPALDGLRIVDAIADRGVLVVVALRGSDYERLVLRFTSGRPQVLVSQTDQPAHPAQLVVLDTGVCVSLDADEHLQLWVRDPARTTVRQIEDPAVGGDWLLHPGDGGLRVAAGSRLYEVSMRPRS